MDSFFLNGIPEYMIIWRTADMVTGYKVKSCLLHKGMMGSVQILVRYFR